jgi:hypothetical protein
VSRRRKTLPVGTQASPEARRRGLGILQVFSGIRTPTEASAALGVTLNRYYQLESRAVVGMLRELEPRARGRQRTVSTEMEKLRKAKERAEREAARNLALVRASQRTLGLLPAPKKEEGTKRSRRPRVRAKALIEAIEAASLPVAGLERTTVPEAAAEAGVP